MKMGAAISFTFDDGLRSQVDWALPIFEELGFKVTFFVIAGQLEVGWDKWRAIAARGHEIGNHSLTHPLGGLPAVRDDDSLEHEIVAGARLITEKLGHPPVSFAYPFNKRNAQVRAVARRYHPFVRERWHRYGAWWCNLWLANARVDRAIARGEWLVPMLHGIETGFQPVNRDFLRAHMQYIASRQVWVDTFGAVSARRQSENPAR
ncbi:MAG: polysaccharide deacetylase family protein [Verrucomicrobiota bacterium]